MARFAASVGMTVVPPKKRKKWPWITAAVFAVMLAIAVANEASKPATAPPPSASEATNPSTPAESTPTTSAQLPPSNATPASPPSAIPAAVDPVVGLREAFHAGASGQRWFGKVNSVDLDGAAVIGRSSLEKGDLSAVAACEALRSAATTAHVEYQSVAVRDARDRTLASWSRLTGAARCQA